MGQPTTVIPTLETARLRLRAHRVDDLPACIAMWGDAEVTRHIGGRPFTREETWGRVLRYAGHWALLGYGYWVIEELASRRFVGEIGFSDFKRDLPMDLGGAPEIGWALATWAHGQGFATEAVRAALAWAETRFPTPRTVCLIDPDNLASLRVAAKCGYRELARVTYKGLPTLLLER